MGEAADLIDTLIRERDEAEQRGYRRGKEDAEIAARELLLPLKREQAQRLMKHAEAAGYRRGVEDAADTVFKYEDVDEDTGAAIYEAILALLEKEKAGNADPS